ncbi:hypothetical protein [Caballeronia terrestris]
MAHELSHFANIGGTKDRGYGPGAVQLLASNNPFIATHGMFIRAQTAA